ncbi:MAG: YcxB family protein [Oscillospiraceae bacterium]|nr:YcxB family protein [Oscillospiraceae bacterium]
MEETRDGMLLEKQYKIPFEMFRSAFIVFQKRFVYPRTYLIMAVLAIVAVVYTICVVYGGENVNRTLYFMIILFCLIMIFFQWFTPLKARRTLMEGVKEIEEDAYKLRIFPEYLEIGTILPPEGEDTADADALFDDAPEENISGTRIHYNKGMHVDEYKEFFLIYQQRSMIYVVPKSAFSEEELEVMRVHFGKRLDKNFKSHLK